MGRNKTQKGIIFALFGAAILIISCIALKLFIIGEPVDGSQINWTVSDNGQVLELRVESNGESAMAFRGWRFKQDGDTLSISARKVLVSALFSDSTYQTTIDLEGVAEIYLGGQKIWPGNMTSRSKRNVVLWK